METWYFVGYIKNLGTADEMLGSTVYGTGTNVDQLLSTTFELTYNIPHFKVGAEYNLSTAWYGKNDKDGKVIDTHSIANNRLVLTAIYSF